MSDPQNRGRREASQPALSSRGGDVAARSGRGVQADIQPNYEQLQWLFGATSAAEPGKIALGLSGMGQWTGYRSR